MPIMSDDLRKVKSQREGYKTNAKKLIKQVCELLDPTSSAAQSTTHADIKCMQEKLSRYANKIEDLNAEVVQKEPDPDADFQDDIDFLETVWDAMTRLSLHLDTLGHDVDADRQSFKSAAGDPKGKKVKLPKLELPKFDGSPMKWQEFWDSFESAIHMSDMSPIDKLTYLKSVLTGDASRVVEGFRTIAVNYEQVIETLKSRYGNPAFAVFAHLEHLIALPMASNEFSSIQRTYDECEKDIRSLVALGLAEDTFGLVFTPIILSKMPVGVRIELHRKNGSKPWELSSLRDLLKEEITARQMGGWTLNSQALQVKSEKSTGFSESKPSKPWPNHHAGRKNFAFKPTASTLMHEGKIVCAFCNGQHFSDSCRNIVSSEERKKIVQEAGMCFKCLSPSHMSKECKRKKKCYHCQNMSHHTSLCNRRSADNSQSRSSRSNNVMINSSSVSNADASSDQTEATFNGQQFAINADAVNSRSIYVQFATTYVPEIGRTVRLYLDSGSTISYIAANLANDLKLDPTSHCVVDNVRFEDESSRIKDYPWVPFDLPCLDGSKVSLGAFVTKLICPPLQKLPISSKEHPLLERFQLADPITDKVEYHAIDILIGLDYYNRVVGLRQIPLTADESGVRLIETRFGWVLSGPLPGVRSSECADSEKAAPKQSSSFLIQTAPSDIEQFWKLEDIGVKDDSFVKDDELALQRFHDTVSQTSDGRYQAGWPWKSDDIAMELADNYSVALSQFRSLDRRLQTNKQLKDAYCDVISKQLDRSIIEVAPDENEYSSRRSIYYMPHHPVVKTDRVTTKVRVVYNGSSKASKTDVSLNDCLLRGPVFLSDIAGLLIRFRCHPIAFTCDVEKAFLQVGLIEKDRDTTRFLWYKDAQKPYSADNLQVLRFARIPFGVVSSPFILAGTIKYHLKQAETQTANLIANNMYIDNVVLSYPSVSDAAKAYKEAKDLFNQIQMNLREWFCNSDSFTALVAKPDRGEGTTTKVLGLSWNTLTDTLTVKTSKVKDIKVETKRDLVKATSLIFDPCGLLSPVVVRGKMLAQAAWESKVRWDSNVGDALKTQWESLKGDLIMLGNIAVPRYMSYSLQFAEARFELHCFCDASAKAYGAAVYLRCIASRESHLVFSKVRLKPLKPITIPRMELMAAVVGCRILSFVAREIHNATIVQQFLWTDSKAVIQWVKSPKVLTVFVENRVKEVRKSPAIFMHVPTELNPADMPSRGVSTEDLVSSSLWWHGPNFLASERTMWPQQLETACEANHSLMSSTHETKSNSCGSDATSVGPAGINPTHFSSIDRLHRVTAFVVRFADMCRKKTHCIAAGELPSPREISQVRTKWILSAQSLLGSERKVHQLKRHLGTFKDPDNGVIRCAGRLRFADLPEDEKCPILLPKSHAYTKLVIADVHSRCHHAGVAHTLTELRRTFWVPSGWSQVKAVIKDCRVCRIWQGGPCKQPLFPPFPKLRVTKSSPFAVVGVDYVGPLVVKDPITRKAWICLFTCAVTRAIHLEVITSLSTDQFLLALRRFVSLYGCPIVIISDNGTYFKLASKVLQNAWRSILDDSAVKSFSCSNGIAWKFIPESAPWMGGFYERLVSLVKSSLKKVLGRTTASVVQLQTIVSEIGSVLNDRPLIDIRDDIHTILRPSDLLGKFNRGRLDFDTEANSAFVPPDEASRSQAVIGQWKSSVERVNQFWKVWQTSYLARLRSFRSSPICPKGCVKPELQEGDTVLIGEKGSRSLWRMAVVEQLQMSGDGVVRSCVLRLSNGRHMTRPVKLLYPLELRNTTCSHVQTSVGEFHPTDKNGQSSDVSEIHSTSPNKKSRRKAFEKAKKAIAICAEQDSDE